MCPRIQQQLIMTPDNSRIRFIDIAKGIGIILVVCTHVYSPLMSWASPCFIPLFFVISGYCTTHPVNLKSKCQKLLTPYLIFTFFLLLLHLDFKPVHILGAVYSRWCLYPIDTQENLLFLTSGNAPLWFLTCMFSSFCILHFIQKKGKKWIYLITCVIITFALSFLPILLPWSLDTAFLMTIFLYAGIYIRKYDILPKLSIYSFAVLTALYYIALQYCGGINLSVRMYGNSILLLTFAAIIGSILIIKLAMVLDKYLKIVSDTLSYIGIHSLPIFCIHLPFIGLWEKVLSFVPLDIAPSVHGGLVVILVILTTYPFAILFDKYVIKYVFSRL